MVLVDWLWVLIYPWDPQKSLKNASNQKQKPIQHPTIAILQSYTCWIKVCEPNHPPPVFFEKKSQVTCALKRGSLNCRSHLGLLNNSCLAAWWLWWLAGAMTTSWETCWQKGGGYQTHSIHGDWYNLPTFTRQIITFNPRLYRFSLDFSGGFPFQRLHCFLGEKVVFSVAS